MPALRASRTRISRWPSSEQKIACKIIKMAYRLERPAQAVTIAWRQAFDRNRVARRRSRRNILDLLSDHEIKKNSLRLDQLVEIRFRADAQGLHAGDPK